MFLNSTFYFLALHNIHNSPFISNTNSKFSRTMKLTSCYFSNFSQHILYSSSLQLKISIYSTFFNKGLSQAVFLSSTGRIYQETGDVNLYLCKFQNIHVPDESGGAIFSTYAISLDSCTFYEISARTGGALSVCSDLNIKNTNFETISATYYGFAEISQNSPSVKIYQTVIHDVQTQSSSSFRRHDGSETGMTYSNFTKFKSSSMVSLGEFGRTSSNKFSFNYVANCMTYERNGALSFWQCDNFLCSDTLFLNIVVDNERTSSVNGIVVWLDGSLQTGKFAHCAFVNCKSTGQGTLLYAEASTRIEIDDCQFDQSKEKSFNSNSNAFLIHDSNKFSIENIDFKGKLINNVINIPYENNHRKVNTFPFGQFLYMCSFLSFVIFIIMLDKYA